MTDQTYINISIGDYVLITNPKGTGYGGVLRIDKIDDDYTDRVECEYVVASSTGSRPIGARGYLLKKVESAHVRKLTLDEVAAARLTNNVSHLLQPQRRILHDESTCT